MDKYQRDLEAAIYNVLRQWGIRGVNMRRLILAVENGDVDQIAEVLGVTVESLSAVLASLQSTFIAFGVKEVARAPKAIVGQISFGLGNPQVTAYLQKKQYDLVQGLVQEQKNVIRQVLMQVSENAGNPKDAVKSLVGTRGPSGQRTGSVIGLSEPQKRYVDNARAQLQSNDPAELNAYLKRGRRNKRYDKMVERAIKTGQPLSPDDIDKIAAGYTNRLLRLRAETIARSEYAEAQEEARMAGIRHMVDSGKISEDAVERVWDSTGEDGITRPSHLRADGQRRGLNEAFVLADEKGNTHRLMYPGDTSLGASGSQTINCRCTVRIEIDYYRNLK